MIGSTQHTDEGAHGFDMLRQRPLSSLCYWALTLCSFSFIADEFEALGTCNTSTVSSNDALVDTAGFGSIHSQMWVKGACKDGEVVGTYRSVHCRTMPATWGNHCTCTAAAITQTKAPSASTTPGCTVIV